jgi:hypothetical protein
VISLHLRSVEASRRTEFLLGTPSWNSPLGAESGSGGRAGVALRRQSKRGCRKACLSSRRRTATVVHQNTRSSNFRLCGKRRPPEGMILPHHRDAGVARQTFLVPIISLSSIGRPEGMRSRAPGEGWARVSKDSHARSSARRHPWQAAAPTAPPDEARELEVDRSTRLVA